MKVDCLGCVEGAGLEVSPFFSTKYHDNNDKEQRMVVAIPANRYGDDFADSQAGHPGIKRSRYEMLQIGSKYLAGKIRGEDFAD